MNEMDRAWAAANLAEGVDFGRFVRQLITDENAMNWVHFRPQHTFICDEEMRLQMDFVGRMENLEHDFRLVAERLGIDAVLPKVNVGNHRDYRQYYDAETRPLVARVYRKDIALFDYDFETTAASCR